VPYRARPSFTVEVKRNNKRVPLTVTAADSSLSERHRLADQLLFGDPSVPVNPSTRPGGGEPAIRAPEPTIPDQLAVEAVTPKAPAEAGPVQRLTGRILPDLFGETRAEERLRQDLDERATRLRAARGARKTRPSVEPMGANTPLVDEPDTAHKAALEPTPAAEPLSLEAPVLTKGEVVEPAAVEPVPSLSVSSLDQSPGRTGRLRECWSKPDQAVGRRAERQEAATRLRAGERWKRRLPQVCW
jgi:hypothetical protein